ncbi:SsgA family sporulation/cell division regulator [Streptomyces sp. NPDC005813]|uniref:SsgA family sporulation/cell division regulator n=1 Tax=Streptomyces sp. NPDC005813 TaxID=3155592 RepID=UPI0033F7ECDF
MPYEKPGLSARSRSAHRMRPLRLHIDRILCPSVRIPLKAEFHYTEADPLVVLMELHPAQGGVVPWVLSRDLLFDGTEEPSGMGDVRLWPSIAHGRRVVHMKLEAHGRSCLLEMDRGRLEEWLLETFDLVHPGTEFHRMDWTAAMASLVEGKRNQP